MIWESQFWKEDLVKLALRLQKRRSQRRWPERSLAKLEKEVFIEFYSIRKLLEAKKLSEGLTKAQIPIEAFRYTGTAQITIYNWNRKVFDAYDFKKALKEKVTVKFLCDQVIHSYIYKEVFDDKGEIFGFLLSSDWERSKKLYHLPIAKLIKLFANVGRDYPIHHKATFNPQKGDYIIRNW